MNGKQQLVIAFASRTIGMDYQTKAFTQQFPDAEFRYFDTERDTLGDRSEIDVVVCWTPPPGLMATLPKLRLIQSVAAGTDHITGDKSLPRDVPICRIVDTDMASGMTAYVTWAVVHRQRKMHGFLQNAREKRWDELLPIIPPVTHTVGIAGLGTLGMASARALMAIGYQVRGWSRTAKTDLPEGLTGFHGEEGMGDFLSGCDTLVCLLPLTAETRDVLDARAFDRLPRGAHLVNVGRGEHVVDADLLAALDDGRLGFATLDAFRDEPLPAEHPFWHHDKIIVTPHIATRTAPSTIARQTAENLARLDAADEALPALDMARGY
ncbi:glyoxylate/hydroxypyruvate reductase A [Xylophilus sp. GOD-11R]|uniref:2-hydroxyacid dehydrogenase n=1 Tax=Xylophilus sp. GOD-11R TaxID=3089814 RepID=UPI00298D21D7|nr:glyoxylate/hydroxypyruvate reductase A [Xylophilus sp. GOD-11R]WPB55150.1 glyoxylate/hydroxypyruvate reductase A [Xylophilus sp. GOD-11R]